jgi:O-acetyl-ADP-ribose deacetylase (regulator of RNase III)
VLVACSAGAPDTNGRSFAAELAANLHTDVIASPADVWQTTDGRVLSTATGYTADGRPTPIHTGTGTWTRHRGGTGRHGLVAAPSTMALSRPPAEPRQAPGTLPADLMAALTDSVPDLRIQRRPGRLTHGHRWSSGSRTGRTDQGLMQAILASLGLGGVPAARADEPVDGHLAGAGLQRVWVEADGNCTYHGFLSVAGPEIATRLRLGRDATVTDVRRHLARVLREDHERDERAEPTRYAHLIAPRERESAQGAFNRAMYTIETDGEWTDDVADLVVDMVAWEFGLPVNLLQVQADGPQVTEHGPAGEDRYVLVLAGAHYWATEPTGAGSTDVAVAGMPTSVPADAVLAQIQATAGEFEAAVHSFDDALLQLPENAEPQRANRVAELQATFNQIMGETEPPGASGPVQPATSFHQHRRIRLQGLLEDLRRIDARMRTDRGLPHERLTDQVAAAQAGVEAQAEAEAQVQARVEEAVRTLRFALPDGSLLRQNIAALSTTLEARQEYSAVIRAAVEALSTALFELQDEFSTDLSGDMAGLVATLSGDPRRAQRRTEAANKIAELVVAVNQLLPADVTALTAVPTADEIDPTHPTLEVEAKEPAEPAQADGVITTLGGNTIMRLDDTTYEIPLPGAGAGTPRILITTGDLFQQPTRAIVNLAVGDLKDGGRLSHTILDMGGRAFLGLGRRHMDTAINTEASSRGIAVGDAITTESFDIGRSGGSTITHVIHAVGPDYGRPNQRNPQFLYNAVANALREADSRGLTSLAMQSPTTSRMPDDLAARYAVQALLNTETEVTDVRLVLPLATHWQVLEFADRLFAGAGELRSTSPSSSDVLPETGPSGLPPVDPTAREPELAPVWTDLETKPDHLPDTQQPPPQSSEDTPGAEPSGEPNRLVDEVRRLVHSDRSFADQLEGLRADVPPAATAEVTQLVDVVGRARNRFPPLTVDLNRAQTEDLFDLAAEVTTAIRKLNGVLKSLGRPPVQVPDDGVPQEGEQPGGPTVPTPTTPPEPPKPVQQAGRAERAVARRRTCRPPTRGVRTAGGSARRGSRCRGPRISVQRRRSPGPRSP